MPYLIILLIFFSFSQIEAKVKPSPFVINHAETTTISKINAIREQYGLKPLATSNELILCAREHSENMAQKKVEVSHAGFDDRANKMFQLMKLSSFGENVGYNFGYKDPVDASVKGWMDSPSHKKNILGDYNLTGVGVSISKEGKFYTTQLFAKKR